MYRSTVALYIAQMGDASLRRRCVNRGLAPSVQAALVEDARQVLLHRVDTDAQSSRNDLVGETSAHRHQHFVLSDRQGDNWRAGTHSRWVWHAGGQRLLDRSKVGFRPPNLGMSTPALGRHRYDQQVCFPAALMDKFLSCRDIDECGDCFDNTRPVLAVRQWQLWRRLDARDQARVGLVPVRAGPI